VLSLPGGGWKETERVQRIVDNIRKNAAIEKAMEEARQAVNRALHALQDAPDSPEKEALENLARFIVDRRV
jgi:octaprenyl-diphosphate synthase